MHEDNPILQLYHEDRRSLFLERRLAEIPAALDALRRESIARKDQQKRRQEELRELEESMRHLERDAQYQRAKLIGLHKRQMGVTSSEAMRAGENEIAGIERSVEGLEGRVLEKMESQEILQREASLRGIAEREEMKSLVRQADELETEQRECGHEQEKTSLVRERLLAELDPALAHRYGRIFKSHRYKSLVALENGACGGCGEKMPPQKALEIRKAGRIEPCQGCGRLVLWVKS